MGRLTFTVEIVKALVWPARLLTTALVLRIPIS
jgi:hypothetical protein